MENRYRIKPECKHLVTPTCAVGIFKKISTGVYEMIDGPDMISNTYADFSDEMFELIEEKERIQLFLMDSLRNKDAYLMKQSEALITNDERILCEKALNGELVEKEYTAKEFHQDLDKVVDSVCPPEKRRHHGTISGR